jgi:pyruvate/2-oxoglutarate dehydrogenase complex dihydrolipoamide dehydrogenase (E3) component
MYRSLHDNYERLLDRLPVAVKFNTEADVDAVTALDPACVVVATGARPYRPRHSLEGVEVVQVWGVLAGARFEGRTLIADWGGDPSALDCAEMLAAEGREVALAVGAVSPGETLHQYQRNAYIARLLRAGVEIHQYLGLHSASGGQVNFRNIFAPELESSIRADVLALAMGRVPHDGLAAALRAAGIEVEEAGDCLSPRTIEEAILEGTLAARRATERVAAAVRSPATA